VKRVRVLVACDWFLKYAASQASALARAGADVELLCRTHALEFGGNRAERAALLDTLDGVRCRELPGRISSPASLPETVSMRRAIRAWRPDLVHAHDNADPRLLAIVSGFPRVMTVHDPEPHPGQPALSRLEKLVRRRWLIGADALVIHGARLAEEIPDWMRARSTWSVPHGADVAPAPLPVPSERTVLLFGRLEPYKGVGVLARAMERVWTERPETTLLVAGIGPAASDVPDDPRVELRNEYVPEEELDALFGFATMVVLPYVQASQSGVAALALGRGIPTVVSDAGSLPEVALDDSFVARAGDETALADAILAHLDHGQDLRARVLEFAQARLSWDACATKSLELYESVLASRR
jgi:glycosyltransferase involved in cell wall biosynthesis